HTSSAGPQFPFVPWPRSDACPAAFLSPRETAHRESRGSLVPSPAVYKQSRPASPATPATISRLVLISGKHGFVHDVRGALLFANPKQFPAIASHCCDSRTR